VGCRRVRRFGNVDEVTVLEVDVKALPTVGLITCLTLSSTFAEAWQSGTHVFLAAGPSFPGDDFDDHWKTTGASAGIGLGFPTSPSVCVQLRLEEIAFPFREGSAPTGSSGDTKRFQTFAIDLKMGPTFTQRRQAAYLLIGAGVFREGRTQMHLPTGDRWEPTRSQGALMAEFGLGIDVHVSPGMSVFVEGRYLTAISTEYFTGIGAQLAPFTAGLRYYPGGRTEPR